MRSDFLLDATGDLGITPDGDIATGNSDEQTATLILSTFQGNWKQFPLTGAGVPLLLEGGLDGDARRIIQMQLEADGLRLQHIGMNGENLMIKI